MSDPAGAAQSADGSERRATEASGPDAAFSPDPGVDPAVPARPPTAAVPGPSTDGRPSIDPSAPAVQEPSTDVAPVASESVLPGAHRGGFQRLPTAPVEITSQVAPALPGEDEPTLATAPWLMAQPAPPRRGLGAWALGFSIVGLVVSLFVGWGFPIGIVGVVAAILALRRPLESRAVAVWALVLGALSILYSAGWLLFAASQADLFV